MQHELHTEAELPDWLIEQRREEARYRAMEIWWGLPSAARPIWPVIIDHDTTMTIAGCRKSSGRHITRHESKKVGPFPCNEWWCDECGPRRARVLIEGVALCLGVPWTNEYVLQNHILPSSYLDSDSLGHIHVACWEDTRPYETVHASLNKQIQRLRGTGLAVDYLAIHDGGRWGLLTSVPLWPSSPGPGKPPAVQAPTTVVPPGVALTWAYRFISLANDPKATRSRGWTPPGAKKRPRDNDSVRISGKNIVMQHLDEIAPQLARAEGWIWPEAPKRRRERVAELAKCLAIKLVALPDDTPCVECGQPIGPPRDRRWHLSGPRCGTLHPGYSSQKPSPPVVLEAVARCLAYRLLSDKELERALNLDCGLSLWFSADRPLLEDALHMVGAVRDGDGRWGLKCNKQLQVIGS